MISLASVRRLERSAGTLERRYGIRVRIEKQPEQVCVGCLAVVVEKHSGVVAGKIGVRKIVSRILVGNYRFIHIFHRI